MKIQMDLPETLNSKLKIYKQLKNHNSISDSIKEILECKFKDKELQIELMEFMEK